MASAEGDHSERRVNIILARRGVAALDRIRADTGESITATVTRALLAYDRLRGRRLLVRDPDTGRDVEIEFL